MTDQAIAHKRLLLLSVSAGAGHVRAAQAIQSHASAHRADLEVLHVDVMEHVSAGFRKLYTDFYLTMVSKLPTLWSYLYQMTDRAKPNSNMERLRRGIERLNTRSLLKRITDFAPDAIVCTHFLPAEILANLLRKERLACPIWVQVTDFDLHRLWVHEGMAGYFAANEEVAYRMRAQGIPAETIHVTGIPIMPAFSAPLERAHCAREFGIDPTRRTVLLMGGGAGLGGMDTIATRLMSLADDFQLVVLTGRNEKALAAVSAIADRFPGRIVAMGFTTEVERIMACCDLAITKPGGLTASECLTMGLPMIVSSPIPGQEERNADFLLEQGVALKAFDLVTLEYRLSLLLAQPAKLADMAAKAKALGRPMAARSVLDIVLPESRT